jgi:hypothetical protein
MKDLDPSVPIELMMCCFVAAGFIVSAVYSIDWNHVF